MSGASRRIAAGLLIGQSLIYGATPLISRLYEPAFVGRAGTFLALASVIGTVAALRWETRIARAEDAASNTYASLGAICILGVTLLVAIMALPILGASEAALLALTSAGIGFIALGTQWSARVGDMRGLALAKVTQGVLQAGGQVAAGLWGLTRLGLQAGLFFGYLGSAVTQWAILRRRGVTPQLAGVSLRVPRGAWLSVLALALASLINLATVWSQLFILSLGYADSDVGHFSIAQRLSIAPAGLVVAALAPPLLARVGASLRAGTSAWINVRRMAFRLAPLTLLVTAALLLVPRGTVEAVLGSEWGSVKDYAGALAPLIFGLIVVGPASQVIAIIGETRLQLMWDTTRALGVAAVGAVGVAAGWSPILLVLITSLVMLGWYLMYLLLVREASKRAVARHIASMPGHLKTAEELP